MPKLSVTVFFSLYFQTFPKLSVDGWRKNGFNWAHFGSFQMTWTMTRFLYMPFRKLWLVTFNYTSLQGCKKNRPKKKRPGFFKKAHLRKPTKKTFYTFPLKYLLSKKWNKQDTHTVICNCFFNQTEQKVMKFKGLEKKRTNRTVWTNSNGYLLQLCTIGIFPPIFLPFLHLNFFWFCNIPNHILKKYTL